MLDPATPIWLSSPIEGVDSLPDSVSESMTIGVRDGRPPLPPRPRIGRGRTLVDANPRSTKGRTAWSGASGVRLSLCDRDMF